MICHSFGSTRLIAWLNAGRLSTQAPPATDRRAGQRPGPGQAREHLHAAGLAAEAGDLSAAEGHLLLVLLTGEPAFVHLAHLQLARLYLDTDRIEEAATLARAAVDDHPEDHAAHRLLRTVEAARRLELPLGADA